MSLSLSNLFTNLGRVFHYLYTVNGYQSGVPGLISAVTAQYNTTSIVGVAAALPAQQTPNEQGMSNVMPTLQQIANDTLTTMVSAITPSEGQTVASALQYVITAMQAASTTVKASSIACSAAVFTTPANTGDGVVVITTKRGDGLVQEDSVAEVSPLICTADSQTGGAQVGNETWQYAGAPDAGDTGNYLWPTGSGASTTITGISAYQDNAGGNLLTNSDMETWSGSPLALNNWTAVAGVWGTDIVRSTNAYTQTYSMSFVGGGVAPNVQQQFNNATAGTGGTLLPLRSYALNFFAKFDVVPAAGTMTVSLVDGNGTVIDDDQGNANTLTLALTTLTTSWVAKNVVFRTPALLPPSVFVRFLVGTGISSGSVLFIDDLSMGLTTPLYQGGPSIAIFSGNTIWLQGDGFTVTTTNDRASANYCGTFQAEFDKFFGMRALGLLLPSSGSPTYADTLITS